MRADQSRVPTDISLDEHGRTYVDVCERYAQIIISENSVIAQSNRSSSQLSPNKSRKNASKKPSTNVVKFDVMQLLPFGIQFRDVPISIQFMGIFKILILNQFCIQNRNWTNSKTFLYSFRPKRSLGEATRNDTSDVTVDTELFPRSPETVRSERLEDLKTLPKHPDPIRRPNPSWHSNLRGQNELHGC